MKKYVYSAIIMFSLLSAGAKPASALIIDAPTLAAKISEWVGKIADATAKVTQQVGQAKQMTSQGFSKDDLYALAEKYATENGKKLVKQKMKKLVAGTKAKNQKKIKAEQDNYVQGRNLYYEGKIALLDQSIDETQTALGTKESERDSKKMEMENKKQQYEHSIGTDKELQALDEYMAAKMEYEALVDACKELDSLSNTLSSQKDALLEEKSKVGTSEDPEYMTYENRLKEMDKVKEDETFVNKISDDEDIEWSMKSNPDIVNRFSPTEEDYTKFIKRYFYDPKELDGQTGSDARIKHQTKTDAVTRERRYLLTNTAAHLLQVSATLRREIPVRTEVIDEMFQNTPKASGELENISSYSATRVENAKALLMYAKLQSARLQYLAARELMELDGEKTPKGTYEKFDLSKYILTTNDVEELVKKAEKTNEAAGD